MNDSIRPLLQAVPEARTVRAYVGERLRELRLLRRLLRLAESVDHYRREQPAVQADRSPIIPISKVQ